MFDLVAAVNNDQTLADNLSRSPVLADGRIPIHLLRGYKSASRAYNAALPNCHNDVVVFAHQDVYLPRSWEERLQRSIEQLAIVDPHWAILGVFGVLPTGEHVGRVWSSGLNAALGDAFDAPAPVQSIDELLIVVRRSSGIAFDDALPGYHLYGTDIVQQALAANRGAYVIHAPVVHNSRPCLYLGGDYFEAYSYVVKKWHQRLPLISCAAPIVSGRLPYLTVRLRHKFSEMRFSHVDRRTLDRNHDCTVVARRLGFE